MFSLTSSISFRVNSYRFFLSDKFVLFCFVDLLLVFFPVFSSRPLCPKQKVFADILRPCGATILLVLIVLIVPGKTPANFAVPGHRAHGPSLNRDVLIKPGWERRVLKRRSSLPFLQDQSNQRRNLHLLRCSG